MRVYIGPYIDRWISKFHNQHMDKKYGEGEWSDNVAWDDHWAEKLEYGLQGFYNLAFNWYLDKKERKIKVKLDPYDHWGADHTVALVILPLLKKIKETKQGAPYTDDEDVPNDFKSANDFPQDDQIDSLFFARWNWILDEMIWAFEQKVRDDWESDYYVLEEVTDVSLDNPRWDKYDHDGRRKHQERMTQGFILFGKYYEALFN